MNSRVLNVFLFFVLLSPQYSLAKTVFIEGTTGPEFSESELSSATEILRAEAGESNLEVVESAAVAQFVLRSQLTRSGAAIVLELKQIKKGKVEGEARVSGNRIEELDRMADRALAELLDENQQRIAKVEKRRSHARKQKQMRDDSYRSVGVFYSIGPAFFDDLGEKHTAGYLGTGFYWTPSAHFTYVIDFDIAAYKTTLFYGVSAGAQLYLMTKAFAPFVGAEFGYGAARDAEGDDKFLGRGKTLGGFIPSLLAGFGLFRHQKFPLEFSVKYSSLLHEFEENQLANMLAFRLTYYYSF